MSRTKLFVLITGLILFVFLIHIFANKFFWYYSIWYFDMPMHMLGGFISGLVSIFILSSKKFLHSSNIALILKILAGVLIIGIAWEIFEFSANTYFVKSLFLANRLDSVSDIFFDLSGGIIAILYYFKNIMPVSQDSV